MKAIKQVETKPGMTVNELINEFNASNAFQAGQLAKAVSISEAMVKDKDCGVFFGLAGAMVPGGMQRVVADMIYDEWINVFVSTGANLTHDLIEALGFRHFKLSKPLTDIQLRKKGLDRIYDSLMQNKAYQAMEKFLDKAVNEIDSREVSIKELLWFVGSKIKSKNSLLNACAVKKIPVYCPAFDNSGLGIQLSYLLKEKKINVPAFKDLHELLNLSFDYKVKGVFFVGGGEPKNYIQQAMQFSPEPAKYGVQITTDRPEFGGSSGAPLEEGVSWGKMSEKGRFVDLYCDATIALPLISAALKERLKVG